MHNPAAKPHKSSYDVVIIGGAIMGSSTAWFLADNPDFKGSVLVVERDPTYALAATTHTASCIRQQFSHALNVRISQFTADYVKNLKHHLHGDDRAPELKIQNFGYMYLAGDEAFAKVLRARQKIQTTAGAATQLMTPAQIKAAYPFYNVDDIALGSINTVDEGYFDGNALFQCWRRGARERGVEYVANEVCAITCNNAGTRVESVTLKSGDVIACGHVVNASGPRGAIMARMAGIEIPIEPRKRIQWIFAAAKPLDRELPLTIDPSGVFMREYGGGTYQAGAHTTPDLGVDVTDFTIDQQLWQDHAWPAIAARIPQFEAIKVISEWAGHYDYNLLDTNAIVGPHTRVANFMFLNGFSGHGLQQSPAMGRGTAEWITYGAYRTLDLRPLHYARIERGEPLSEQAII